MMKKLLLLVVAMPLVAIMAILGLVTLVAPTTAQASCILPDAGGKPVGAVNAGVIPNGWEKEVQKASAASGVPVPVLGTQLEAESGWNPRAVSPVGAKGVAQFMPGTAAAMGLTDPFDPIASIAAQGKYMGQLLKAVKPIAEKTGTDPIGLALAAYNAGEGAVYRFNGVPPYPETQGYVQKILANAAKYSKAGTGTSWAAPSSAAPTGTNTTSTTAAASELSVQSGCKPAVGADAAVDVSGNGDDYPWKNSPPNTDNPATKFNYRECVDFAWWRLMEANGYKDPNNLPFTGMKYTPGSAITWASTWAAQGWEQGKTPRKGAVIWYAPFVGGALDLGHVAIVKDILPGGKVLEEGYNGAGGPHVYYQKTIDASAASMYLYVPNWSGSGKVAQKPDANAYGLAA